MRFVYFLFLAVLAWSYWLALKRARDERTPFTPIMGWLIGLGYFVVAPLTILVLHGGYQIPDFYQANERYASVNLSNVLYLIPMLVIFLSLFFAFQSVALFRPQHNSAWSPWGLSLHDHRLK